VEGDEREGGVRKGGPAGEEACHATALCGWMGAWLAGWVGGCRTCTCVCAQTRRIYGLSLTSRNDWGFTNCAGNAGVG
jgi:hypothetical protein